VVPSGEPSLFPSDEPSTIPSRIPSAEPYAKFLAGKFRAKEGLESVPISPVYLTIDAVSTGEDGSSSVVEADWLAVVTEPFIEDELKEDLLLAGGEPYAGLNHVELHCERFDGQRRARRNLLRLNSYNLSGAKEMSVSRALQSSRMTFELRGDAYFEANSGALPDAKILDSIIFEAFGDDNSRTEWKEQLNEVKKEELMDDTDVAGGDFIIQDVSLSQSQPVIAGVRGVGLEGGSIPSRQWIESPILIWAVVGSAFLLVAAVLLVWVRRRRKSRRADDSDNSIPNMVATGGSLEQRQQAGGRSKHLSRERNNKRQATREAPYVRSVIPEIDSEGNEIMEEEEEENVRVAYTSCSISPQQSPVASFTSQFPPAVVGIKSEAGREGGGRTRLLQHGVPKINQDRHCVSYPYGEVCGRKTALFAVYDGHGASGETVSEYARNEVERRLKRHPDLRIDPKAAMIDVFEEVDKDIGRRRDLDPGNNGSTACVLLLQINKLHIANLGDSRAVLARWKKGTKQSAMTQAVNWFENTLFPNGEFVAEPHVNLTAVQLTKDQTAEDPAERERVLENGGFVAPSKGYDAPLRVWLDRDCTQVGLSMTRSFGDFNAKGIGVIAEPIVTTHQIDLHTDEFVIVASDGIWEFVDPGEAVRIVEECLGRGYNANDAAAALVNAAMKLWEVHEEDYRDDITAMVVWLPGLWENGKGSRSSRIGTISLSSSQRDEESQSYTDRQGSINSEEFIVSIQKPRKQN